MPANIEMMEIINQNTLLKVILKEGRNRQIRKVNALVGNPVKDLQRISISGIKVYGPEGEWREIKRKEWISIIN